jgi:hypothetical protein
MEGRDPITTAAGGAGDTAAPATAPTLMGA